MFCLPVSLMFGVIGIIFDRSKWLSIATTAVAAVPISLFFYMMILRMTLH